MPKTAKSISEYNKLLQTLDKKYTNKINEKTNDLDESIKTQTNNITFNESIILPPPAIETSYMKIYQTPTEETNVNNIYLNDVIQRLEEEFKDYMLFNPELLEPRPIHASRKLKKNKENPSFEPIPVPELYLPKLITIEPTVVNTVDDLLCLIEKYPFDVSIKYNINMKTLHCIKEPLTKLKNMIGMKNLKETLVEQILYFVQGFNKGDFMHTVIYGPPGTGKTEIAKIMGEIYSKMGVLNRGAFKKVTRSDLIAGYLGQTAIKTTKVIDECLGGVLFIDEAYALGSSDKKDSFSKECIDTLCEALSNHKENLMVIIAGYQEELNDCFFSNNQGLESRFTWRFKTDDYTAKDLHEIFLKMIKDIEWQIDPLITGSWFEKKMEYFKYFGRDMETLLSKVKIAHSKRVFCSAEGEGCVKKTIALKDMDDGFALYLKNEEVKNRSEKERHKQFMHTIYV
jgi:hypothetical protein